jgi:NAD(P)-dependent dehydrogenase (short-subunit alcohol dehydrogenase family)
MTIPPPNQLLDLSDRAVLVTGGGKGIGAAIALRFAEAGANVAVNFNSSSVEAEQVVKQIQGLGRQAVCIQADTTRPEATTRLVQSTARALGRLDVLVNNAGLYPLAALEAMSEEEWDRVLDTNLKGVFLCTQAAARQMKAQGDGGAIVNIASIEGESPAPLHSHYNAAKAGVLMYTRAAALELGPYKIRVNSISPGLIWREGIEEEWPEGVEKWQTRAPLERLGRPDDVADACLFFASPASRWVTGANLRVDGGVLSSPAF